MNRPIFILTTLLFCLQLVWSQGSICDAIHIDMTEFNLPDNFNSAVFSLADFDPQPSAFWQGTWSFWYQPNYADIDKDIWHIFGIAYDSANNNDLSDQNFLMQYDSINKKLTFVYLPDVAPAVSKQESYEFKDGEGYHLTVAIDYQQSISHIIIHHFDTMETTSFEFDTLGFDTNDYFDVNTDIFFGWGDCSGSTCYGPGNYGQVYTFKRYYLKDPEEETYTRLFDENDQFVVEYRLHKNPIEYHNPLSLDIEENNLEFITTAEGFHATKFSSDSSIVLHFPVVPLVHYITETSIRIKIKREDILAGQHIWSSYDEDETLTTRFYFQDTETIVFESYHGRKEFLVEQVFPDDGFQNIVLMFQNHILTNTGQVSLIVNGEVIYYGPQESENISGPNANSINSYFGASPGGESFIGEVIEVIVIPRLTFKNGDYSCIKNCQVDLNQTYCFTCEDGYYWNKEKERCANIKTEDLVTYCLPYNHDFDYCVCIEGHRWDSDTLRCLECLVENCATCDEDSNICEACVDGLQLSDDGSDCSVVIEGYYQQPDGSYAQTCPEGYTPSEEEKLCVEEQDDALVCIEENYCVDRKKYNTNKNLADGGTAMSTTTTVTAGLSIASSASGPSAFGIIVLNKFLLYIRYMNIQFPENLYIFLKNFQVSSISFAIDEPASFNSSLPKTAIPDNFQRYDLHPRYFASFWDTFCTILIIFGLAMLLTGIVWLAQRSQKRALLNFFYKLKIVIRWNLFFLTLIGGTDEIVLFSSLDFRTLHINSFMQALSFLTALSFMVSLIVIMAENFYLVLQYQKIKKALANDPEAKIEKMRKFSKKWEHHQVLFKGYRDATFMTQAYMFFFILRAFLYNFFVSYLFEYPVAQAVLMFLLSLAMLVYMLVTNPFKSRLNMLEILIYEICIILTNLLVLIMAAQDDNGDSEASQDRTNMGTVIIICFFVFSVNALVFMIINYVLGIITVIKTIKQKKKERGKLGCVQLLTIPFESGGIDLGEIEAEQEEKLTKEMKKKQVSFDKEGIQAKGKGTAKVAPLNSGLESSQRTLVKEKSGSMQDVFTPQKQGAKPKEFDLEINDQSVSRSTEKLIGTKVESSQKSLVDPTEPKNEDVGGGQRGSNNSMEKIEEEEGAEIN